MAFEVLAEMLKVIPDGVALDEAARDKPARTVIDGMQQGLFVRIRPPLMNRTVLLPEFAAVGAAEAPAGALLGCGRGLMAGFVFQLVRTQLINTCATHAQAGRGTWSVHCAGVEILENAADKIGRQAMNKLCLCTPGSIDSIVCPRHNGLPPGAAITPDFGAFDPARPNPCDAFELPPSPAISGQMPLGDQELAGSRARLPAATLRSVTGRFERRGFCFPNAWL